MIREALEAARDCKVLLRNYRKDGSFFWNELIISPIRNKEGELTHFVGVQNDVTEREEARALLKKKTEDLNALNRRKDKMLGMAAHDLRGPLGTIQACLTLLSDPEADANEQQEFSKIANDVVEKTLLLINDLLDVSAIETGELTLYKKKIVLEPFLNRVVRLNRIAGESKGIALSLKNLGPEEWVFDPERVEQVLDNLIGNAFKFSHAGTMVQIEVSEQAGDLILSCHDKGQGICEEDLDKLFSAFQKTQTQPTNSEKGHGLGLCICKKIVELHGGRIEVKSVLGEGTTFQMHLPRA